MTIGSHKPAKEKKSRKSKEVIADAKIPLLPTKHEEDVGFDEFNGASFTGAVFNLSTTIVGAGIMSLPATMKVLGLAPGVAMIIFMAFLTEASIEMLLRCSRAGKTSSYGGVMHDAFGKYGRILLQVCVLVNNIGVLVVYMIIIGDVLSGTTSSGTHYPGVLEGFPIRYLPVKSNAPGISASPSEDNMLYFNVMILGPTQSPYEEGDSAKALAMAGLSVVGQNYYGVFLLRGEYLDFPCFAVLSRVP